MTFAIVTLTFLFVVQQLAFNLPVADEGLAGARDAVPPSRRDLRRPFYLAMLAIFLVGILVCWYVRSSKLGLMLFAIRDDEERPAALGVRTDRREARSPVAIGSAHGDGRRRLGVLPHVHLSGVAIDR